MIMKTTKNILLLAVVGSMLLSNIALAQEKASPPATATGKCGDANVTINYSSPAVKGRKVWGDLVPYDKVWRAGANEATVFETDKDLKVEGKTLPAGKYSLYAQPGENEWIIIFNSQTGMWGIKRGGAANIDRANDVLTVTVKPKKSSAMNERLLYEVSKTGFSLKWENLEVPVMIK
jgi:hypothetical protein